MQSGIRGPSICRSWVKGMIDIWSQQSMDTCMQHLFYLKCDWLLLNKNLDINRDWYHIGFMVCWIPRNFKIFNFKPDLPFLRKNQNNHNELESTQFNLFTFSLIFAIFLKMAILIMDIFVQNFKNHL